MYKYFHHNKEYIQHLFDGDVPVKLSERTAVQVRQGDYYKFPDHHPQLSPDYFMAAAKITGATEIDVYTDDIQWCQNYLFFGVSTYYPLTGNEDWQDLLDMRGYKNLIISNSSFGWWGAYLNTRLDKKVYVPSIWFGRAMVAEGFNIDDLVLPDWEKIKI